MNDQLLADYLAAKEELHGAKYCEKMAAEKINGEYSLTLPAKEGVLNITVSPELLKIMIGDIRRALRGRRRARR